MTSIKNNIPILIAEAGVNHNGSMKMAKKMINEASKAGADYIKFQAYNTDSLVLKNSKKAPYQLKKEKFQSQYDMLKRFEFDLKKFRLLKKECRKKKIKFLLSIFDVKSIEIIKHLKIKIVKIPSGELNNFELLNKISKLKVQIILSTGMSNFKEIKKTLLFLIKNGVSRKKITLLHCHSDYPTRNIDANLNSIKYLRSRLNIPVGLSDHTKGINISLIALGMGATMIEKHFTLNQNLKGPDHQSSIKPNELKQLALIIRNYSKIIGRSEKILKKRESKNMKFVRKSIVATTNIKKGEKFTENNISTRRPDLGISSSDWFKILNKKSKKNFKKYQFIR